MIHDPRVPVENDSRGAHLLPSTSLAGETTWSGSNPKCFWSSLRGAEAPNVFIPMIRPDVPTYRSHPKVEACSTATRAVTLGGSTVSRYSRVWCSKMSHDGIETTRERMPSECNFSCASTARLTSLPEAMRITSGFPLGGSAGTYAPRATPDAGAYLARSRVGRGWRDNASTAGSWRSCRM